MEEQKSRILVVDDIKTNVELMRAILEETYEVYTVTDGAKAVGLATELLPDLILLDVMMPEVDGFEVCRQLKESDQTRDIPVIFVTALDDQVDEKKGLEVGAIDYLAKPVNAAIVTARVRNHIRLKKYSDMLKHQAMVDGLTGLANRRRFDEYIDIEWKRGTRSGTSMSILMLDVDFFKKYNDRYGHLSGDDCLCKVAGAIKAVLTRPSDIAARYGGEEFAVILPETQMEGALKVAGSVKESIESLQIPHESSETAKHVTVSIGLCCMEPSIFESVDGFIACADAKLYEAKKEGRNKIAW